MKKPSKYKENAGKRPMIKERRDWLLTVFRSRYLMVFLLSIVAYSTTIFNDYNLDDELVTRNHPVSSHGLGIDNLQKIFSQPYYKDNMGYSYGYRPLTTLSFAVEHSIFGDSAHAGHIINLLLYCGLCVLLLGLLELMLVGYNKFLPMIAAMLFAVHPLHTEVVASIKNRDEILSFMCGAAALYVLLMKGRRFWWQLVLSLLLFVAGMLFKPNLVMFPSLMIATLIFYKRIENLHSLILIIFFSCVSTYFLENVADGSKLIYVVLNILFCLFVIISCRYCPADSQLKKLFVFKGILGRNGSQSIEESVPKVLNGQGYFVFLLLNTLIGAGAYYISLTWSTPWALIVTAFVYGIEFYFFRLEDVFPLIFLFDAAGLILISGKYGQETILYAKDNFNTFFILFHLFIVVGLKGKKFWPIYFAGLIMFSAFMYTTVPIPELLISVALLGIVTFMYRKGFYKTRIFTLIFAILTVLSGLDSYHLLTTPFFKLRPEFFTQFAGFVIFLLIFGISFFKISLTKAPAIIAFFQITLIAMLLICSHEFRVDTREHLVTMKQPVITVQHNLKQISNARQIPDAYSNQKLNRPITFIEVPVEFNAPESVRIATSSWQFGRYLLMLIKPWPMSFYYGYMEISAHKINEPTVILDITLFSVLLLSSLLLIRKNRLISLGIMFMTFSILPYLYIVSAIPGLLADRYTFQASLGFSILVGYGISHFFGLPQQNPQEGNRRTTGVRKAAGISFGFILLVYLVLTMLRNSEWKDSITLMRHDIKIVPESIQAHNLLGINLVKASFNSPDLNDQRLIREEALGHLKKAYELYPGYFNFPYDVGRIFMMLEAPDSALKYFKIAYSINPRFPDVQSSIIDIYFMKNDFQDAIPYLIRLIQENPDNYSAYDKLSLAYFKTNQARLSIQTNLGCINMAPSRSEPYVNIGICYFSSNQKDSAKIWFLEAMKINPNDKLAASYLQKFK